ncbi:MAG: S1 RNA-binding domain-containing protein [Clostridia bacterium]|nr:S1 RNA-binding domain-containing protein [Clostridia bacterium]
MYNYLPEGKRIGSKENTGYISSLQGLEAAMAKGIILEAVAHRCTSDMTLEFSIGGVTGIMKREECAFCDDDGVKDIAVITRVGKPVCFKILNIIYNDRSEPVAILSRRAAQLDCFNNYLGDLIPGDVVPSRVTHMEHFGAFVDVGCGIVSLLPIDAISVSRISHPCDRFEVGMYINTVIKSIDYNTSRIYVSHKELLGTWEQNAKRFAVGQTVAGIVRSIEDYGIFVELAPNLAGLAEYRSGVEVGKGASVYIKNIFADRMKIKLVLIDTCDVKIARNVTDYYTDGLTHIDNWRYSPIECNRVIESCFV